LFGFILVLILCIGLHLIALSAGYWTGKWFGFDHASRVAIAFSCSQKTLPVALLLFERYYQEKYPLAIAPLLFYHVGTLLLDTLIAHQFKKQGGMESG